MNLNSIKKTLTRKFFDSLDIEGVEFDVLKTVPWEKVDIEVLLIELIHAGSQSGGSREDVHLYLSSKNYVYLGTICKNGYLGQPIIILFIFSAADDVFVRKNLFAER